MLFRRNRRRSRTGWISKEDRLAIYRRDDFRCVYCDSNLSLQLDHIRPRSKGGSDSPRNLATACKSCNMAKSNRIIPGRTRRAKIANFRRERMSRNSRKPKYTNAQPRKAKPRLRFRHSAPANPLEKRDRNVLAWIGFLLFLLFIF